MLCYTMLVNVMPYAWLHVVAAMTNVSHETVTTVITVQPGISILMQQV